MHSDATPSGTFRFFIAYSSVTSTRAAAGADRVTERDRTAVHVHFLRVELQLARTPSDCAANASLSSHNPTSPLESFVFCKSFSIAGQGPMPMIDGSTPALAAPRMIAIGFKPAAFARSSDMTTSAAAPSLMPDALPRGHAAVLLECRTQLREHVDVGAGARMLVLLEVDRIALLLREGRRRRSLP
jgi:hypothetical protein